MGSAAVDQTKWTNVVKGLLDIARVAQPPDIFAIDPRVQRALKLLGEVAPAGRPPTVQPDAIMQEIAAIIGHMPERVAEADPADPLTLQLARERAFQSLGEITLDVDLLEPLARAMGSELPIGPSEALNALIRSWLVAHGYMAASLRNGRA